MSFDAQRVGPSVLAKAKEMLEAEGIVVSHLVIAYDGAESNGTTADPSYVLGSHFLPKIDGHQPCHTFLTQSALRAVGPEMHGASGYLTTYLPDGSILVVPSALGNFQREEDDDGHDQ